MKPILDLKVVIGDAGALNSIRQEDVVRVLLAHGWTKRNDLPGGCELWTKPAGDEVAEVIVTGHQVADHIYRVSDVMRAVSAVDKTPPLRLLRELLPEMPIG